MTNNPVVIRPLLSVPRRLFAVGDIHGCARELETLISHLFKEEGLSTSDVLIFIGDYVDRGGFSRDVIELLIHLREQLPSTVFLKGNHEHMMLSYLGLEAGRGGEFYLRNGGVETLASYHIMPEEDPQNIVSAMPKEHLIFLQNLELGVSVAEFVFVHAGINPVRPLDQQNEDDLLWIRQGFTEHIHRFGRTIVFGHTPFEDVMLDLPYKIGIDTGLVYGNRLSCVELVEGRLLQVRFGEQIVKVASLAERINSRNVGPQ